MNTSHHATKFVPNGLCLCDKEQQCEPCLFWQDQNTPAGRKGLCGRIINFLVFQPFYQYIISQTVDRVFPDKIIYEDQKDICTMLFESALFDRANASKDAYMHLRNRNIIASHKDFLKVVGTPPSLQSFSMNTNFRSFFFSK